jgi:hypothetical protein
MFRLLNTKFPPGVEALMKRDHTHSSAPPSV